MDENLKHFQLLEALRSNNMNSIIDILNTISKNPTQKLPTYGSPLHLAVSISSKPIIEKIVESFCRSEDSIGYSWINERNTPNGETPLIIASKLGRGDIIDYLFKQFKNIDDTVRDTIGRVAYEAGKNGVITELLKGKSFISWTVFLQFNLL